MVERQHTKYGAAGADALPPFALMASSPPTIDVWRHSQLRT